MALSQPLAGQMPCAPTSFHYPTVPGGEILSIQAFPVSNYSFWAYEGFWLNHGPLNVTNLDFCNVTVTYTHPGQYDKVNVQVWLPTTTWNERLQALGGGGWNTGMFILSDIGVAGAIGDGYAAVSTDGGHSSSVASDWALKSPGNVDMPALEDFASVALNDMSIVGKSITESFYGRPPKYSYFSGCSQGGRQGYMLAQRYPNAFDGIVASAPALNWTYLQVTGLWPQAVMNDLHQYPHPCELNAMTASAIRACDADDGLIDAVIADPSTCKFNPYSIVNYTINGGDNCNDTTNKIRISKAAADVASAAWAGPQRLDGTPLGYGTNPDAPLVGWLALANTDCLAMGNGSCVGVPLDYSGSWVTLWVEKNPNFDLSTITKGNFEQILRESILEYEPLIGTDNPNLSEFRKAGRKLLTFHGLADQTIPPHYTRQYYESVKALDPSVQDYYRLFEAPGLNHCFGGYGVYPPGIYDSLVQWVENGKTPDVLEAMSLPDDTGRRRRRILCPYPEKSRYKGTGDGWGIDSFYCSSSPSQKDPPSKSSESSESSYRYGEVSVMAVFIFIFASIISNS